MNQVSVDLDLTARYRALIEARLAESAEPTCSMCGGTDHTEMEQTDDGRWNEDCVFESATDSDGRAYGLVRR